MNKIVTKNKLAIYRLLGGRSNSYLVSNGSRYIIVDTGPKKNRKILSKRLLSLGVNKDNLVCLILTHAHFDHVENAAYLKRKYGMPILFHNTEASLLVNGLNADIHGSVAFTRLLTNRFKRRMNKWFTYESVSADILIDGEYDLREFGFDAYLIPTPGHSAGSISLVVDHEVAIVGDAMFGIFKGSVFPPFAVDVKQLIMSWKALLDTGCLIYLPGHGTGNQRKLLQKCFRHRSSH